MLEFPRLSTNAIAQYPFRHAVQFQTFRLRFLDRSEQRFRQRRIATREWDIDLSLLTQEEVDRVREFVKDIAGRGVEFLFTDPRTGLQYAAMLAEDTVPFSQVSMSDGRLRMKIITSEY